MFTLEATCGGARAGRVGSLLTPATLLHTSFGQPPHLTPLLRSSLRCGGAGVRFGHLLGHEALVAASGQRLSEYSVLGERFTVLTLRDPSRPLPAAAEAGAAGRLVDTWGGKRRVGASEYAAAAAALRVDAAETLYDEVVPGMGGKRTRTAIERSAAWARECVAAWGGCGGGDSGGGGGGAGAKRRVDAAAAAAPPARPPAALIYVSCPSAVDAETRACALAGALGAPPPAPAGGGAPALPPGVLGFSLGGLCAGERDEEREAVLRATLPALPAGGLRLLQGPLSPATALDAVTLGVDLFDGDEAGLMSTFGYAAAFFVSPSQGERAPRGQAGFDARAADAVGGPATGGGAAPPAPPPAPPAGAAADGAAFAKREEWGIPQVERGFSGVGGVTAALAARASALLGGDATKLHLADPVHAADARPLVPGCACFACAGSAAWAPGGAPVGAAGADRPPLAHPGHSRAYIHHLVNCKEILGLALLSVHNAHHWARFFAEVRRAVVEGRFGEYTAWFKRANCEL
jgi:queuine tRNA-ribosyltransferase subunit QTRTD1